VAGYLAAKRGAEISAVYFHSPPFTSERAREKVLALAERLAEFTGKVTFYCVPFTDVQLYLKENVQPKKLTLLLKRAMMRAASVIAAKTGALALVTGDSLGQVASQTLQSLAAVNSASALPVLRPLCGMDKIEILDMAAKIGTADISALPFEDCCTLFVDEHPETKPRADLIEKVEAGLGLLERLIAEAADKAEVIVL
jgi:thiamine biosynthesis protein ThiI